MNSGLYERLQFSQSRRRNRPTSAMYPGRTVQQIMMCLFLSLSSSRSAQNQGGGRALKRKPVLVHVIENASKLGAIVVAISAGRRSINQNEEHVTEIASSLEIRCGPVMHELTRRHEVNSLKRGISWLSTQTHLKFLDA